MGAGISGITNCLGSNLTKINKEKQSKHYKNSKNYIKGRSYLLIPRSEIQNFVNKYLPIAEKINESKYRVRTNKIIGVYVDYKGDEFITSNAIIVTSKTGCHVYPARPENFMEE